MIQDIFDACPNCQARSFFRNREVFKCPKCSRFFCPKCVVKRFLLGYKCPNCKYHLQTGQLTNLRAGYA
jgi:hypothetical protein